MKQNKRIFKYSALVSDAGDSSQQNVYADLPAGANAAGFMGFLNDQHFIEPGGLYFVPQGTPPETVTGTVPSTYSLAGRNATIVTAGDHFAIAAAAGINEGDLLVIADSYGRLNSIVGAGIQAGTTANVVAKALTPSAEADDIIRIKVIDMPVKQ